jgi:hypothetical protein
MIKDHCPLCLGECESKAVLDLGGRAYDCPECRRFAFKSMTNEKVSLFLKDREGARVAIRAHVKNNQTEGYLELSWSDIGKILKDAGVDTKGLSFK